MRFFPVWNLHSFFRVYALAFSLLPCVLTAAFLSYYLSDRLHQLFMAEIRQKLELQREFLDTWISYRQRDVQRLASVQEIRDMKPDEATRAFRQFLAVMPEFRGLGLIDAHGRTVADTIAKPGLYLGDRAYFKAAQQGKSYISDMLVGRATGTRLIMFASPVTSEEGAFLGALFAPVSLDMIDEIVKSRVQFGERALLLDGAGKVIAGADTFQPDAPRTEHPALKAMKPEGGDIRYIAPDGHEVVAVALKVNTNGWVLVGEAKTQALREAVRPVIGVVFAVGLVSYLLILPILFRMARKVEGVVSPLARHAHGVAAGDYRQPAPVVDSGTAPLELRMLADAYETMRAKIVDDMHALETLALTDELTRLPNRRRLMEEGLRLLQICIRAGNPCSCMVIDVDHFKQINDQYGHAVGDRVLTELAAVFRQALRGADLLGRLGGEEFLVVCTNTGPQEARQLADRLRQGLKDLAHGQLAELRITVSIGVATLNAADGDGAALFDRLILTADMAMYQAKASGRDQVVLADCDPRAASCSGFIS